MKKELTINSPLISRCLVTVLILIAVTLSTAKAIEIPFKITEDYPVEGRWDLTMFADGKETPRGLFACRPNSADRALREHRNSRPGSKTNCRRACGSGFSGRNKGENRARPGGSRV